MNRSATGVVSLMLLAFFGGCAGYKLDAARNASSTLKSTTATYQSALTDSRSNQRRIIAAYLYATGSNQAPNLDPNKPNTSFKSFVCTGVADFAQELHDLSALLAIAATLADVAQTAPTDLSKAAALANKYSYTAPAIPDVAKAAKQQSDSDDMLSKNCKTKLYFPPMKMPGDEVPFDFDSTKLTDTGIFIGADEYPPVVRADPTAVYQAALTVRDAVSALAVVIINITNTDSRAEKLSDFVLNKNNDDAITQLLSDQSKWDAALKVIDEQRKFTTFIVPYTQFIYLLNVQQKAGDHWPEILKTTEDINASLPAYLTASATSIPTSKQSLSDMWSKLKEVLHSSPTSSDAFIKSLQDATNEISSAYTAYQKVLSSYQGLQKASAK